MLLRNPRSQPSAPHRRAECSRWRMGRCWLWRAAFGVQGMCSCMSLSGTSLVVRYAHWAGNE